MEPPAPGREAAGDVEREVAAAWAEALHVGGVAVDDDFFDLGGHSLLAVKVMARLSRRFGDAVSLLDLFQARTVAALAAVIARRMDGTGGAEPGPAAVIVRLSGTADPGAQLIYCFHPSGGTVECYRELARALSPSVAAVGVQSRAVARADVEYESVEGMAEEYARLVAEHREGRPVWLLGWSFGAQAAACTAAALERRGIEVERLVLLDPPVRQRAGRAAAQGKQHLSKVAAAVHAAVSAAAPEASAAVSEIVKLAGRHEAMLRAARTPKVRCPVSVFLSTDRKASRPQIVRAFGRGVAVEAAEAGHFTMLSGPAAGQIARNIAAAGGDPPPSRNDSGGAGGGPPLP